jgi:hypothetical protein
MTVSGKSTTMRRDLDAEVSRRIASERECGVITSAQSSHLVQKFEPAV